MDIFENFEFIVENGNAVIKKYNGNESFVIIPDYINGFCVKSIGNEAFRGKGNIKDIVLPKNIYYAGDYAFCECRGINALFFGDALNFAGAHLLYNCRGLEKIRIPSNISYIGDGFVKNCDNLKHITISSGDISSSVSGFLNELNSSFTLYIESDNSTLVFPAFGYEYIDKCYSRTFETITHGAGVTYRRCIEKNKINYDVYDLAFKYASNEETADTMCFIAVNRLTNSYNLSKTYKEMYIKYVTENILKVLSVIIKNDNMDFVDIIENENIFTADNIKEAVMLANEMDRPDFTALFMDIKMKRFGKTKKVFDI